MRQHFVLALLLWVSNASFVSAQVQQENQFIRTENLDQQRTEARYEVLHDGRVLAIGGGKSPLRAAPARRRCDTARGPASPRRAPPPHTRGPLSAPLRRA